MAISGLRLSQLSQAVQPRNLSYDLQGLSLATFKLVEILTTWLDSVAGILNIARIAHNIAKAYVRQLSVCSSTWFDTLVASVSHKLRLAVILQQTVPFLGCNGLFKDNKLVEFEYQIIELEVERFKILLTFSHARISHFNILVVTCVGLIVRLVKESVFLHDWFRLLTLSVFHVWREDLHVIDQTSASLQSLPPNVVQAVLVDGGAPFFLALDLMKHSSADTELLDDLVDLEFFLDLGLRLLEIDILLVGSQAAALGLG